MSVVPSRDTLLSLIRDAATLEAMQGFLRARDVPFSATSWPSMLKDRVIPALEEGHITERQLYDFLCQIEDHGKQHVFLYRAKPSARPPDLPALKRWLRSRGAEDVLTNPRISDKPAEPTITSVVWDSEGLTIKVVETREHRVRVGEHTTGTTLVVTYNLETVRAVNIAKLHSRSGLLELRVHSHRGGSRDYSREVNRLLAMLAGLLNPKDFTAFSLSKAKGFLLHNKQELKHIQFSDARLRKDNGNTMQIATGRSEASLFDDPGTSASIEGFEEGGDTYCDAFNIWWLKAERGAPSEKIHVLLSGEDHEFAVTQKCNKADYEHVFRQLRQYNR